MKSLNLTALTLLMMSSTVAAQEAAGPDPALARMREGMKKMVQRISEAEAGRVAAEAAKAAADTQVAELTAKLKAAEKKISDLEVQSAKEKASTDKTLADLNAQSIEKDKSITRLTESLGKWKEGFDKAKTVAEGKEGERAAAAEKVILLERRVAAAETKNAQMHRISTEILSRYEKFGLGTALLAREPFTRNMKAKLQSMVDEYGDKIDAQRIVPAKPADVKTSSP